ncbi:UvrD-helicase domain-containing protein [Burkholderia cepacia]|uniref:UvrD-helicase domain-containing protein n=1 Tax=Burkholderia cepacia TaxID=292 RepID=UPI001C98A8C0|nr:UvrD-helicase domain-containing protein [Burkholderia cepacia]
MDEGQDCNPLDLQVLSWLREYGVHVTFVCDPNQAIYEFRNSNLAAIQEFKETYPDESRRELTGNFRSSPAVCRLTATLKSAGGVDQSVGDTANVAHSVLLLTYRGRAPGETVGQAFLNRIAELGLDATDAVVLAHSGKVAQRAAGVALNDSNGNSRIESLACKVAEFWSPAATVRSREAVVQAMETLLLDLMGLRQPNEHPVRTVQRIGMDRRAHRRCALGFLMSLPKACGDTDADRLAWIARVHTETERLNLPLPAGVTVRNFFRRPPNARWSDHLQIALDLGLRCAKIHEAKGREYGAVCVVIPPNRAPENRGEALFESWEASTDSEAKRVLYVGLTRARHLAALAVPVAFADRCVALLAAGQVPHTRRDL